jgi:SAM-dependent methyltransferase
VTDEIRELLRQPAFPRASAYDPEWVLENQMGPNALWLIEWLSQGLDLKPGMRVLDLGCGKALTSVFLAKELGVRVWATDLWIGPDNNWRRVVEAGVEDLVCPLRAEAHALPFAQGFFDAVVSIDAYHYFGTDELYLGHLAGFVKPGGSLGIVVPGLTAPLGDHAPAHLLEPQANGKVFWEDECASFHTADWWRALWSRSGRVCSVSADTLPDGWRMWRDFERATELSGKGLFPSDAEALERDQGRTMGFVRVTATRSEAPAMNCYDPALGARFGVDR